MKTIKNKHATPFKVGDFIAEIWARDPWSGRVSTTVYKIVDIVQCHPNPANMCYSCRTGNELYIARKFVKRIGRRDIPLCPCSVEYKKYDITTKEVINEDGQEQT